MLRRGLVFAAVLADLWALWEAYRAFGVAVSLTWPFEVNERTMPHIHDMIGQLFEPSRRNGPLLIEVLGRAALFTAKEAAVGFALGAGVGFLIAVALVHSTLLQRGFCPTSSLRRRSRSSRSRRWSSSGSADAGCPAGSRSR